MAGPEQVNVGGAQGMKMPSAGQQKTEVLHQRKKLPYCPMRMAIGGFAATVVVGYFVLYSKKKPEASAMDVAKVATGFSHPDNTHPRN
ncbi:putative Transmembrane protein [Quillaja saponaria]|uniref:Transmembrane protein n=1 Tax=Quillaja saponaria TaxID=32244 RepID=A0AAD7QDN3_QUISA|nr:putative Transmembrane protein [Quillaja saponaria]